MSLFHGEDAYRLPMTERNVLLSIKLSVYWIVDCCCQAAKLAIDEKAPHTDILLNFDQIFACLPPTAQFFFCNIAWRLLLIRFVLHKCVKWLHPWFLNMSAVSTPSLTMLCLFIHHHWYVKYVSAIYWQSPRSTSSSHIICDNNFLKGIN